MESSRDFVKETKDYLKQYNQFKVAIENLKDDIADLQEELELDTAAPVVKYDSVGGGTSTNTPVEAAAARRDKLAVQIHYNERQIKKLARIIRKVDRAIDGLKPDDQALIRGHFIERRCWAELSAEKYFTEKWARERSRKALKQMALMIFGECSLVA